MSRVSGRGARSFFALMLTLFIVSGCSSLAPRNPVPVGARGQTSVLGLPNARFFLDEPELMAKEQALALEREAKALGVSRGGVLPAAHLLSLSGGGDNGAFGAGLLTGWTKHGGRPKFKLVTGVSTGALIAPFAFLGSEYDTALTDVYTNISPSRVFEKRFLPYAALAQDALADTAPLYRTISHYVDDALLEHIADEYKKGRLLLIQTTDLDAGAALDMEHWRACRQRRPPRRRSDPTYLAGVGLYPAAFPPVIFDVEANGQSYQELHVDGGGGQPGLSRAPVAQYPRSARAVRLQTQIGRGLYHSQFAPHDGVGTDVEQTTLPIAERAVSTMINYNGVGDLYRMYLVTQRAGASFNLALHSSSFHAPHPEEFDPAYMRTLYHFAYDKAAKGYPWDHAPPGFQPKSN